MFLWGLLVVFNASLWIMLLLFHLEVSLRAREAFYFGTQLFPVKPVPIQMIYLGCTLLTVASTAAIWRDRRNTAARERLRTLLLQILDSLEIGVLVLDQKHHLVMANDSARRLLPEIPPGYAVAEILSVLAKRTGLRDLVKAAAEQKRYCRDVAQDLGTVAEPWPIRVTTLPLKDPQKRTTGTLLLVQDVRDVVRMERQMRTAERLSSLGALAAVMAHEIRNPLEAMDLNLVLLERSLAKLMPGGSKESKSAQYVKVVESEISRLAKIVENFLTFARPSSAPVSEVRLGPLLQQIAELLANQAKAHKVDIELSIADAAVVQGSEDQLKQAFLNLVINSMEAMPRGGSLRIRVERSKGAAVVQIQDTGVGIPEDRIPKLFDPFFTTRSKGTGLGLTIVHRIVEEHNGRIRVASTPGAGSTFTVELPGSEDRLNPRTPNG
jgi:signal transduction histidine kinase